MSILLIDDSASVREVLRLALESEGYSVLEAADGREGVRLFREHRPAVTIVDIVMPEKDGIETVREILTIDPKAVIFTMSGADDDYQEVARMVGARRGFRKPVKVEELLTAVNWHREEDLTPKGHSGETGPMVMSVDADQDPPSRFGMSPMPTPGGDPGRYEEAWAQWFLESSFFRDFVFRNPKGKGGRGELADAVVLFDDIALMCQSKAVFSARDPMKSSPAAVESALSQLKYTSRMLYDGHVQELRSETLGSIKFDRTRYRSRFGLIVLAAEGPPFDAEAAVPGLGQMGFPVHVLSLEDFGRISTLFDTAADLITYLESRQVAASHMRHRVHAEAHSLREITGHIEDILRAFDPAADATVLAKTAALFRRQAVGELLASPEWKYGLLIDDLIAHLHEKDPSLPWNQSSTPDSTRRILEFLGWLTRYRRIQLGRRGLEATDAARDGNAHYFAHYQRPRRASFVFLATQESRAQRVKFLRHLATKALAKHGGRTVFGVATEPIGPGRSYDVVMFEADLTPEQRAEILKDGDPFSGSPETELE